MYSYIQRYRDRLLRLGCREQVPLSELTSFRIGGDAAFVLEPTRYEQILEAVSLCKAERIPVFLLGRGTNLLAPDAGFDGLILRFDRPIRPPVWEGTRVSVCAGTSLTQLAKEATEKGLMGLELLCGIPGTIGGACAMNAGAFGAEIKSVLRRVRVLSEGEAKWTEIDPAMLGYRKSPFSFPSCIVLEAELKLRPDDGGAKERMKESLKKRQERQPLEYPSAGSVFKRPEGHFAGALIEQCGMKGRAVGGACVSEKHAGFIVNTGGATERDVLALIGAIQRTVSERTGVALECEIKRIGEGVCI